jgi:hypothetical protein
MSDNPDPCAPFQTLADNLAGQIEAVRQAILDAEAEGINPSLLQSQLRDLERRHSAAASALASCRRRPRKLVIRPTFTANFDTSFGANAAAAQAAWRAAAQVFTTNFADRIQINITVDAVPGTNVFGSSGASYLAISYADLLARVSADAKTQNDQIALGPGGSMTAADPTNGTGTWWLTRSQAKALDYIPDDQREDGTITFGAGNPFTFSGAIAAGTYDFQGIAAHEISEVMGRVGLSGGTVGATANSFSLLDNYSYTGPGTKGLRGGPGNNFSKTMGPLCLSCGTILL